MDIFRTLRSGSLSVTAILDFSGKANTSIHGLGEDDTATLFVAEYAERRHYDTLFVAEYAERRHYDTLFVAEYAGRRHYDTLLVAEYAGSRHYDTLLS